MRCPQAAIKLIPIDKVVNWSQSSTGRELAAILGFTNYHSKFFIRFCENDREKEKEYDFHYKLDAFKSPKFKINSPWEQYNAVRRQI